MEIGSTGSSPAPSPQVSQPQQGTQRQRDDQAQQTAELEVARSAPDPGQRTGTVIDTQA